MPAVALTDRDGLYGAARFVAACAREGVRPILGASLTVREPPASQRPPRGPARHRRRRLREPLPARSPTRTCWGAAATPGCAPRADLRARRRAWWRSSARGPHPGRLAATGRVDAAARAARPVPRGVRTRASVRRRRAPGRGPFRRGGPRDAPARRARWTSRAVATNAVRYLVPEDAFVADALECMRRIVPVAANHVTRANAEGWLKPARRDARALRRAPGPLRRHARPRRAVHVRPRAAAPCTSRTSPRRAGRGADAVLAERCWRGVHERGMRETTELARATAPRALDDPAHGLRGVLPHRRRHRGRHQGDGHPLRMSRLGGRLARVLPHRHLRRGRAPPRPVVRAVHEPDARRSCPTSTSTSSRRGARTSTTWCSRATATTAPPAWP